MILRFIDEEGAINTMTFHEDDLQEILQELDITGVIEVTNKETGEIHKVKNYLEELELNIKK